MRLPHSGSNMRTGYGAGSDPRPCVILIKKMLSEQGYVILRGRNSPYPI